MFSQENEESESRIFQPSEMKEDFQELFLILESIHPDLYFYTPRHIIDSLRKQARIRLSKPLTTMEFWKVIAPIVVQLKDGHTALSFPWEEWSLYKRSGGRLFPLEVRVDSLKLFVVNNYSYDPNILPENEIMAINGITSKEIILKMQKYHNGERMSFVNLKVSGYFGIYLWALFPFDEHYKIEYRNSKRAKFEQSIYGISGKAYDSLRKLHHSVRKPDYSFYKTRRGNIGVIDFRRMRNNRLFKKFNDSVFNVIQDNRTTSLIIDVRKNGGGNSQLLDVLLSYFNNKPYTQALRMDLKVSKYARKTFRKRYFKWYLYPFYPVTLFYAQTRMLLYGKAGKTVTMTNEPETHKTSKPFFNGNVFLLIGPNTFSSANILADVFKCYEMGTILGEETGGLTIAFGDLVFYSLENTQLRGNCSYKQFFHPCGIADNRGVIPDIEIKQNYDDNLNGKDTVLEYTVDYILSKGGN